MTAREWLALCLVTETNQPHEMPAVAAVILNRLRGKGWPKEMVRVVRQAKQFSAFNATLALGDDEAFAVVRKAQSDALYAAALACADDMMARPEHQWPLTSRAFWYFSPISMQPAGSIPPWAGSYVAFCPGGIDPYRFVFLFDGGMSHPLRGNAAAVFGRK